MSNQDIVTYSLLDFLKLVSILHDVFVYIVISVLLPYCIEEFVDLGFHFQHFNIWTFKYSLQSLLK